MKAIELAQKAISLDESCASAYAYLEFNIPISESMRKDCSLRTGHRDSPEFHGRLCVFCPCAEHGREI